MKLGYRHFVRFALPLLLSLQLLCPSIRCDCDFDAGDAQLFWVERMEARFAPQKLDVTGDVRVVLQEDGHLCVSSPHERLFVKFIPADEAIDGVPSIAIAALNDDDDGGVVSPQRGYQEPAYGIDVDLSLHGACLGAISLVSGPWFESENGAFKFLDQHVLTLTGTYNTDLYIGYVEQLGYHGVVETDPPFHPNRVFLDLGPKSRASIYAVVQKMDARVYGLSNFFVAYVDDELVLEVRDGSVALITAGDDEKKEEFSQGVYSDECSFVHIRAAVRGEEAKNYDLSKGEGSELCSRFCGSKKPEEDHDEL